MVTSLNFLENITAICEIVQSTIFFKFCADYVPLYVSNKSNLMYKVKIIL